MLALTVQKKGIGGGLKGWSPRPGYRPVPHAQKKAPHRKVFSKWQDSPDEVEAHERTAGAAGKVLEGR